MQRKQRLENFQESAGGVLAPHFINSTILLLNYSLQERCGEVYKTKDNHYSVFAESVIFLASQSLEVWINSVIVLRNFGNFNQDKRNKQLELVNKDLPTKLKELLPNYLRQDDVELFNEVRIEIAHFFPRNYKDEKWYKNLIDRDLIISELSYPFNMYKLAYWSVDLLMNTGKNIAKILEKEEKPGVNMINNFVIPSSIISPENLSDFDKKNDIKLTKSPRADLFK
ncbi:hypothetical protein HY227_01470 [Candidatus Wolfebacteria bacterium]|nr:hypothetical protein [Candidatus Wolfebacteria bacterium]